MVGGHLAEAEDVAGDGDGSSADVKVLGGGPKIDGDFVKIKGGFIERGGAAEAGHAAEEVIDFAGLGVGVIDLGDAAAAEMDDADFGDEGGEGGPDGRVYGVAALGE